MKNFFALIFCFSQIVLSGQEMEQKNSCKILSLNIDKNGTVTWITKDETGIHTFVIEEYRWKKWVKIGEVKGIGLARETEYTFQAIPYSGKNKIRVRQEDSYDVSKEVEFTSDLPVVKFTIEKSEKKIKFTSETLFEIIDSSGKIVKRGFYESLSYSDLPKGTYILNYDNSSSTFKY